MTTWGGRFKQKTSALFKNFNDSLDIDKCLLPHDIEGSCAWTHSLETAGVLTKTESDTIQSTLCQILEECTNGSVTIENGSAEDIHSWVEARLISKIGDLGKKLHTGRSRNDQVVTDLKLWIKKQSMDIVDVLDHLQEVLANTALEHAETVMPGFTHWQQAQPIVFGHWCLAYAEMLKRDKKRLINTIELLNECPFGSGALAGTAYAVDRSALSTLLGFRCETANSLDAVSDRDYVVDMIYTASMSMMHLSRMAEDMIFFNSDQVNFISFSDEVTSGSSLMPQKKNPDAWELTRGKTGKVYGQLITMLTTLKAQPMAYNKDLQEDKTALFTAIKDWFDCLQMSAFCLEQMTVHSNVMQNAVENSFCNATELADDLVSKGIPFREAHEITGRCVLYALEKNKTLNQLTTDEWNTLLPTHGLPVDLQKLHWSTALKKKNVKGGTASSQVIHAASTLKKSLQAQSFTISSATINEAKAIAEIVGYWAEAGENLPVSLTEIQHNIRDFKVAKKNDRVAGCGFLYIYGPNLAEIRSLGFLPSEQGAGGGSLLVKALMEQAKKLNIKKIFALTRAPGFFEKLGFKQIIKETLPEKVIKDCQLCPKQQNCDEVAVILHL